MESNHDDVTSCVGGEKLPFHTTSNFPADSLFDDPDALVLTDIILFRRTKDVTTINALVTGFVNVNKSIVSYQLQNKVLTLYVKDGYINMITFQEDGADVDLFPPFNWLPTNEQRLIVDLFGCSVKTILMIGPPGVGKSTLGLYLSENKKYHVMCEDEFLYVHKFQMFWAPKYSYIMSNDQFVNLDSWYAYDAINWIDFNKSVISKMKRLKLSGKTLIIEGSRICPEFLHIPVDQIVILDFVNDSVNKLGFNLFRSLISNNRPDWKRASLAFDEHRTKETREQFMKERDNADREYEEKVMIPLWVSRSLQYRYGNLPLVKLNTFDDSLMFRIPLSTLKTQLERSI